MKNILFVCLLIVSSPSIGQVTENLKFRRYSIEHGLSQASALCMLQDNKGYLWIGTQDGLNRFDGYTFTIFRHNPEDSTSLSSNYVNCIFQDSQNRIWVGTRGGLNLFDPQTETFTHFQQDPNNPASLSNNFVRSIYQDRQNRIWVGTNDGGLNLFDQVKQRFFRFTYNSNDPESLSDNFVEKIYQDNQNRIWIGTGAGLNLMDPETQVFSRFQHDPDNPTSLSNNSVTSIFQDRQNRIWVGTNGGGLNLFDPETQTFSHFHHDPNDPGSLNNNRVNCIIQDQINRIWVGTNGGGLNIFDPNTQTFSHNQHDPAILTSLSDNNVISIIEDLQYRIWVGTEGGGINLFDPLTQAFSHFQHDVDNPSSLSNNDVLSFLHDKQGRLWVGTYLGGLNLMETHTKTFQNFQNDPNNPVSLSDNTVMSIYEDRLNRIWVGTYGGGLNLFNPQTKSFSHFLHDPNDPVSLSRNIVTVIFQDRQNRIWVGTGRGINLFNDETGNFTRFQHEPNNPASLSHNIVWEIFQDRQNRIWVGTDGGLNLFHHQSNTFTHYQHDPFDPNSLSDDYVSSILQDHRDRIWVGTNGGLNLFNPETATFKAWREKDGLSDDVVYGILEDDYGNLWLSTNKGINKFNPETNEFIWYDQQDGLQSNEFWSGAFHKGTDGKMYFGGINGFNVFHPDSIKNNTRTPPVVVTDFLLFNKSVEIGDNTVLNQAPDYIKEITLEHNDYFFAFEFSALNYRQPEKNQYAYKLEGFNEDWIYTNYKDRKATYTNVPHGTYTFRVKASNDDGYWNEEGASVTVIILPRWWLTTWAKVLWASLCLGFLFTAYKLRTGSLKVQKRKLQEKVDEQTRELKQSYDQLKELDEHKESMTAMLVHDFKNSLNSVISFSEDSPTKTRLQGINQAGKFMLNMVLNMLDVQKFETTTVKLSLKDYPISKVINHSIEQLGYLFDQKSIQLNYTQNEELFVNIDYELITRCIINILSNGIKFAPINGKIDISIEQKEDSILISIKDNGEGIPSDKIDKVFDKYSQIHAKKSGSVRSTGIGLTFCKTVVEAHGGTIGVESIEGQGSNFFFTLPIVENIAVQAPVEQIDIPHDEAIVLSDKEKTMLEPYVKELEKWEVYDYSEVVTIIESIDEQENQNIISWKERIMKALHNGNQELFNELMSL